MAQQVAGSSLVTHPIFCLDSGGAHGVSPFFVSESITFTTKTVVPPAFARVQSGVPSCPRAPPLLFVVALRSGLYLRSGAPCFARCVAQQVAGSSLVTHPIFLPFAGIKFLPFYFRFNRKYVDYKQVASGLVIVFHRD